MKKPWYLSILLICFASGCYSSIDKLAIFNVVGTYQLIWFSTRNLSDFNPGGTLEALEVDEDHIDLFVRGQSGKITINYSYANVLVTSMGVGDQGAATYTLIYKEQVIGSVRVNGVSRSIELNPSSGLKLEGLEL